MSMLNVELYNLTYTLQSFNRGVFFMLCCANGGGRGTEDVMTGTVPGV